MGLTTCFRKSKNLDNEDLAEIRGLADAIKKESGKPEIEAVEEAILAVIDTELANYSLLHSSIEEKKPGVAPTADELRAELFTLADDGTILGGRGEANDRSIDNQLDQEGDGQVRGGRYDATKSGSGTNDQNLGDPESGNAQGSETIADGQEVRSGAANEVTGSDGSVPGIGVSGDGRPGAGGEGLADAGRTGGRGGRSGRGRSSGSSGDGETGSVPSDVAAAANVEHFHIDNPLEVVGGGQVARFNRNKDAIELYHEIEAIGRPATEEEKKILAGYTGWGSFGQELFQGSWDYPRPKQGWEERDSWLREELGKSEWESAQRSIINAHYTDPPTVMAMWQMVERMGFSGGRVLEPSMGIGNFFGMMPVDLKSRSELSGIELDELTGGMAQMIYPGANIQIKGYQESKTPDNFYDLIIGNWPFENTSIADRKYQKLKPYLHDYFFLKAIDQVRPGGLVVGITSKGTMDKVSTSIRLEMAKKAELVASYRLPTGAFEQYAGTKVVTDIVILRKREEPKGIVDDAWIESSNHRTPQGTPVRVNNYYHENPENVIGTIDYGHGTTTFRPGLVVRRPDDMQAQLDRVVSETPEGVYQEPGNRKYISYIANHTDDRQGSVTFQDGELYVVRGEHLAKANDIKKYVVKSEETTAKRVEEIISLIDLRKKYGELIQEERSGNQEQAEINRKALSDAYEQHIDQYDRLNESWGLNYLKRVEDPFFSLLAALEVNAGTKDAPNWTGAKILTESTMRGVEAPKNPSIEDAFILARTKYISPTLKEVVEIANKPAEQVKKQLIDSGAVFETPHGDIIPSDIYLSGNVRVKLREAKAALEEGVSRLQRNVDALEKVIPKDVPYHKIEATLGATWISTDIYKEYIAHMLNRTDTNNIDVRFAVGRWRANFPSSWNHTAEATTNYGMESYPFKKLLNHALANTSPTIKYKDDDGVQHTDVEATQTAVERTSKIRGDFMEWVWQDPERRVLLEQEYNEARNAWAVPTFDGSFMKMEGMALQLGEDPLNMRKHQVDAIWKAVVNRKSLNAHEVGSGKTFTMGGIAVESRRYGIARKPLLFAHNANSATVAAEIQMMYPAARILYIDNLDRATIQHKLRQIANDDWDLIVVPHSLIERMALTEETIMGMAREEIAQLENEAREAAIEEGAVLTSDMLNNPEALKKLRSTTAKELVKSRNKIIENARRQGQMASRENAISFEDLGIDMILVDEAHEFKKPPIVTRMNTKGLNKKPSKKSISLQYLARYVRANNNGGNIHLFTGTPITNTLTEVYHQMRYIMEEEMKESGVDYWDGWFSSFATEKTTVEISSAGEFEAVTRLSKFINGPQLRQMIGQYMDVVFTDDMSEMKPRKTKSGKAIDDPTLTEAERAELENGRTEGATDRPYKKTILDIAEMHEPQKELYRTIKVYARAWRQMDGRSKREAILSGSPYSPIIHGNMADFGSLDIRLVNSGPYIGQEGKTQDDPNSKASRVVNNVMKIYDSQPLATQAIFMQAGIHSDRTHFSVAKDVIERLVKQGIPREEIVLVSDNISKKKRKLVAEAVNRAEVRVVIGTTQALGTGVNMQDNLRAMHHMDAPWMPGHLEQRNGRGHRQRNQWNTVLEYRYITEELDGKRWQVLAVKQRFIDDFLKNNTDSELTMEGDLADEEGGSILKTFSQAAGDPRILIKANLGKKIENLQRKERLHTFAMADAKSKSRDQSNALAALQDDLASATVVNAQIQEALNANAGADFTATILGQDFTARKEVDAAIKDYVDENMRVGSLQERIGKIMGLDAYVSWPGLSDSPVLTVKVTNHLGREVPITGRKPKLQSVTAAMRAHSKDTQAIEDRIERVKNSIQRLDEVAQEPFKQAQQLADLTRQLREIEQDMDANPVPPPAWLRSGAPIDTEVFWNKRPYIVTGHRWTPENWYVTAKDSKGDVLIPYTEVTDKQGIEIYEAREFVAPEVVEAPQQDSGENDNAPGGVNEDAGLYSGYGNASTILRQRDADLSVRAPDGVYRSPGNLLDAPQEVVAAQASDNFDVEYRQVETARFNVGLDKVESAGDAAHFFAPLRRRGQEAVYALVLDKNKKPLSMIRHTEGLKSSASVDPATLIGAIANTPGAASVWLGHNHPSTSLTPSKSDRDIVGKILKVADGLGIEFAGNIIVTEGKQAMMFDEKGNESYVDVTPAARRKSVPVTTREIRKRPRKERAQLSSPQKAQQYVKSLATRNGLVLMDNRHNVGGVLPMTVDEMSMLRDNEQVPRIFRALDATNASAAIIVSESVSAASNLARMLNNTKTGSSESGVRVLDALIRDYQGQYLYSSSQAGTGLESLTGSFANLRGASVQPTGIDPGFVRQQADEFLENLKLQEQIEVLVYDDWRDFVKQNNINESKHEEASRALGYISGNRLHLISGNLQTRTEIPKLLRHEILAHYGLSQLVPSDRLAILKKIVASRNIPFVKQHWDEVSDTYGKKYKNRDLKIAEEVFARVAQLDPKTPPKVWERIVDMLIKALRKIGLVKNTLTRTEQRQILGEIAQGIRSGKPNSKEFKAMVAWHGSPQRSGEPVASLAQKDQTEYAQAVAKGLPMDESSRMRRAEEMGYGGRSEGYNVEPLDDKWREDGRYYGKYTKQKPFNQAKEFSQYLADRNIPHKKHIARSGSIYITVDGDLYPTRNGGVSVQPMEFRFSSHSKKNTAGRFDGKKDNNYYADVFEGGDTVDDAIKTVEATGGVRSVNAAFDPDFADSSDLMANLRPRRPQQPQNEDLAAFRKNAGLGPPKTFTERMKGHVDNVWSAMSAQRQEHLDSVRQGSLDRFHGINRAAKRNFGNLSVDLDPYITARLSSGISAVMRAILTHGQPKWSANGQHLVKKEGTVGLLEIFEPVADNFDAFMEWMVAVRAERLMAEGKERNFTEAQIRAGKAQGNGHPEFRQVAREFAAFKRSILDVAEQSGLIDPEARKVWDKADWIPFYRQIGESGNDSNVLGPRGAGKGLTNKSSGIRQLRGGTSAMNDPLENIIMNFHRLLDASLKNNAARKAIAFAPDSVEKANYKFEQEIVPNSEIKRKLVEAGTPEEIVDMMPEDLFDGMGKMWAMKPPTDKDVVRVMVGGKAKYYRISDPLLLRAVTAFQPFDMLGLDTARAFKRLLTSAVTATPEFMLRNFIRDTFSTMIIGHRQEGPGAAKAVEVGAKSSAAALKGIIKAYNESGGAEHMLFAGASFASGYIDGSDPEATARAVRRDLRKRGLSAAQIDGFMGSTLDSAASMWDKYRHVSESIENANREAVFESMLNQSGNVTAAAYESKDLMDFSLRGDWAAYQTFADVIPFFNARVQGLYRLGRTDPAQLAVRGAIMLMIPTLLNALANLGNEDYDELSDWDKDTYWHFWPMGEHLRIPKPFEVGVIFATIPERFIHAVFGEDDAKKFGMRLGWNIAEQLNLIQWPQFMRPAMEVVYDYDSFRGRNIENFSEKGKFAHLRYNSHTSATMRELMKITAPITDKLELSPKDAEHLLVGYLGTFGAWGLAVADYGARALADDPARPTLRVDDLPVLRVIYRGDRDTPAYSTQYINDVYDAAKEYAQILRSYRDLAKEGKLKDADQLLIKHRDRLTLMAPMAAAAKGISAINAQIDHIYMDKVLTQAQKRRMVDAALADRNRLARQGIEETRALKKAANDR